MPSKYTPNDSSDDESHRKHRRRHASHYDKPHRRRDNDRRDPDPKEPESEKPEPNPNGDMATMGSRTGGVYIPPFRLAQMMKEVSDKSSVEYQRLSWDALRKSINGLVNKVNATNIQNIIPELFAENLIRGRGLFCRSCMKSQMASPGFTHVFAALVAVVNTKFPEVGELLLRRIVLQLKRAYKRNDKPQLLAAVKFVAHLVNQQVAHEIIALELLAVLLENPTDDSVEVAVGFVTECGSMLQDMTPKGLDGAFERFRGILHEGEIDKRVQFLIEGLFALRKAKFQGYPAVRPELDLVEQEDQVTHEISLQDEVDAEITLDIFKADPNFLESEKRYEELKKSILGEESEDEEGSDAPSGDEDEDDDDEENESDEEDEEQMQIKDETETNLVNLRRTIYLTIMSSVDFEEAGHKLLKIKLEPGQEMELCIMLLECCSQERTYLRYYGLLGQRFCMINKVHQENFEKCFVQQYSMIHRLETNKLRNVAKFFAHLLGTDALPWHVLAYIRLTEEDTTSSSRIFIKILFQEISEHLGIRTLNERLSDPAMQDSFESIFPRDNPKNTRFAINFFTSIGLGGITENLREYLKNMPRLIMQQQKTISESGSESDSGSGSGSGSGSESSETSESESDASSTDEDERRGKRSRSKRDGSSSDEDERRRKRNKSRKDESSSDEDDKRRSSKKKHESISDEDEKHRSKNRRDDLRYNADSRRKSNRNHEPIADSDDDSRRKSDKKREPIPNSDDDRRRKSDRKHEPIADSDDDRRRKIDRKREPIADLDDDRRRKSDMKREPIANSDDDRQRKSDRKREPIADSGYDDRWKKSDEKLEPTADSDDDRRRNRKREPIGDLDDNRWRSNRKHESIGDESDRRRERNSDEDGHRRSHRRRDEKEESYRRSSRRE